jgi:hypothetical protein
MSPSVNQFWSPSSAPSIPLETLVTNDILNFINLSTDTNLNSLTIINPNTVNTIRINYNSLSRQLDQLGNIHDNSTTENNIINLVLTITLLYPLATDIDAQNSIADIYNLLVNLYTKST